MCLALLLEVSLRRQTGWVIPEMGTPTKRPLVIQVSDDGLNKAVGLDAGKRGLGRQNHQCLVTGWAWR